MESIDRMLPDTLLSPNTHIQSESGKFRAGMQADGSFVVMEKLVDGSWVCRWDTKTTGGSYSYIYIQADHNLVLYIIRKAK